MTNKVSLLVALCALSLALQQVGAREPNVASRARAMFASILRDDSNERLSLDEVMERIRKNVDASRNGPVGTRTSDVPPDAPFPTRPSRAGTQEAEQAETQTEAPRSEAPKTEAPKIEAPQTPEAKPEEQRAETPRVEQTKVEPPTSERPATVEVAGREEPSSLRKSARLLEQSEPRFSPAASAPGPTFLGLPLVSDTLDDLEVEVEARDGSEVRPVVINGVSNKLRLEKLLPWTSEYTGTYSNAYGPNDAKLAGILNTKTLILKVIKFLENIRNQAESIIFEWTGVSRPTPVEVPEAPRTKAASLPPKTIVIEQPHQQKTILVHVAPGITTVVDRPPHIPAPKEQPRRDQAEGSSAATATSGDEEHRGTRVKDFGASALATESSSDSAVSLPASSAKSSQQPEIVDKLEQLKVISNLIQQLLSNSERRIAPGGELLNKLVGLGSLGGGEVRRKDDSAEILRTVLALAQ